VEFWVILQRNFEVLHLEPAGWLCISVKWTVLPCTGAHSTAHVQCCCKCGLQKGAPKFLFPRSHCSLFSSLSVVTENTQPFGSLSVVTENTQPFGSLSVVTENTQPFGSLSVVTEYTSVWQFIRGHREYTAVWQFIRGHREYSDTSANEWPCYRIFRLTIFSLFFVLG